MAQDAKEIAHPRAVGHNAVVIDPADRAASAPGEKRRETTQGDQLAVQHATRLLSLGGILAAIGAASCCVISSLLFALGVSGAWIGDLTALEPYQPIFAALSLAFIGWGVWRCAAGRSSPVPKAIARLRVPTGSRGQASGPPPS
jgi:hypothetical protein